MPRIRHAWSTTLDPNLYEKLKKLSDETRIPMTKLVDEAIDDLLEKHKKIDHH